MLSQEFTHEKNEFQLIVSKLSHEIRNPLFLIQSELNLLASLHPEITGYQDWDIIQNNLTYMKDLLTDFSSYSNAGQLSLKNTLLSDYLKNVLSTIRPTLDYLNIQLKTDISENLSSIFIDQLKLRQALLNLLRNAQEAVSSNGEICFSAQKLCSGQIQIIVSDNGCGMSPEQLTHIFAPFVTYKKGGNGLGLSIARQIIEAHGGSLTVKSHPNQGSSFCILLG